MNNTVVNITAAQSSELLSLFEKYRKSKQYEFRKKQSTFCNFANAVIRYIVGNDLFDKDTATSFVHLFAVHARKETIQATVKAVVVDTSAQSQLLSLLDACPAYGYTAVGKTKIELTAQQAQTVKQFLLDVINSSNVDQIKQAVATYSEKQIPNCTPGIYSPWLHYVHPTLCPIANGAIEPFLSYLGIPKSRRTDYRFMMDVLAEVKDIVRAEDYSILDDFLFIFDKMEELEPREPRYWVFNHKYGGASTEDKLELIEQAITYNYAFMQYEYGSGYQRAAHVTMNWNQAILVKEGDYIFLKSDAVYAVGKAVMPRKVATVTLKATDIIRKKSCGKYISGSCKDLVRFEDAEVFYEDLTDGIKGNWGQRIDVDSWKYFSSTGVKPDTDEYLGGTVYDAIREISVTEGTRIINKLFKGLGMKAQVLEQLRESYNVILTGAPGTGKTYLAKQVARLMLFGKSDDKELNIEEQALFKEHVEFVQFHPSYDYSDFVEGLRPIKPDGNAALGFERRDGIFKDFCRRALESHDQLPFIMIVDEINRGELSKIFGELFFSIDPGYRGKTGLVKTQYQNMVTDGCFADGFYVPENVYIIGTMNDIDRSVESMDFAIRRRFAWIEVLASQTEDDILVSLGLDIRKEAKERLDRLNDAILTPELHLGTAYQIGASYFLKLFRNPDFTNLWEHHLKGVLFEYLRGQRDPEEKLEILRKAYFGE